VQDVYTTTRADRRRSGGSEADAVDVTAKMRGGYNSPASMPILSLLAGLRGNRERDFTLKRRKSVATIS